MKVIWLQQLKISKCEASRQSRPQGRAHAQGVPQDLGVFLFFIRFVCGWRREIRFILRSIECNPSIARKELFPVGSDRSHLCSLVLEVHVIRTHSTQPTHAKIYHIARLGTHPFSAGRIEFVDRLKGHQDFPVWFCDRSTVSSTWDPGHYSFLRSSKYLETRLGLAGRCELSIHVDLRAGQQQLFTPALTEPRPFHVGSRQQLRLQSSAEFA